MTRDPLEELGVPKDSIGENLDSYGENRLLYVFSGNSSISKFDVLGLECGIEVCVRPLAFFPENLPWWASPANHVYIQHDTWSAGFQKDGTVHVPETNPNHSGKKCFAADKMDTGKLPNGVPCKCATCDDIKNCLGHYASQGSKLGGYPSYCWLFNNCGHWVINTLNKCCMKGDVPWHWYGPNGVRFSQFFREKFDSIINMR